jgi:hypothetical protein
MSLLDSTILNVRFAQPIPEAVRLLIISMIWGPTAGTPAELEVLKRRSMDLSAYFEFYHKTAVMHMAPSGHRRLNTHKELLFFVGLLKANPNLTRQVLREACDVLSDGDTVRAQSMATIPTEASSVFVPRIDGRYPLDVNGALTVAVRTMLALNISPEPGPNEYIIATRQSDVTWNASETLTELVDKSFPKAPTPSTTSENPIELGNLRARSLQNHFGIKLEWTKHFPDHLKLEIGTKSITLKVFELASILEISCKVTVGKFTGLTTGESLQLYVSTFIG